jgi:hypothetical protein
MCSRRFVTYWPLSMGLADKLFIRLFGRLSALKDDLTGISKKENCQVKLQLQTNT